MISAPTTSTAAQDQSQLNDRKSNSSNRLIGPASAIQGLKIVSQPDFDASGPEYATIVTATKPGLELEFETKAARDLFAERFRTLLLDLKEESCPILDISINFSNNNLVLSLHNANNANLSLQEKIMPTLNFLNLHYPDFDFTNNANNLIARANLIQTATAAREAFNQTLIQRISRSRASIVLGVGLVASAVALASLGMIGPVGVGLLCAGACFIAISTSFLQSIKSLYSHTIFSIQNWRNTFARGEAAYDLRLAREQACAGPIATSQTTAQDPYLNQLLDNLTQGAVRPTFAQNNVDNNALTSITTLQALKWRNRQIERLAQSHTKMPTAIIANLEAKETTALFPRIRRKYAAI